MCALLFFLTGSANLIRAAKKRVLEVVPQPTERERKRAARIAQDGAIRQLSPAERFALLERRTADLILSCLRPFHRSISLKVRSSLPPASAVGDRADRSAKDFYETHYEAARLTSGLASYAEHRFQALIFQLAEKGLLRIDRGHPHASFRSIFISPIPNATNVSGNTASGTAAPSTPVRAVIQKPSDDVSTPSPAPAAAASAPSPITPAPLSVALSDRPGDSDVEEDMEELPASGLAGSHLVVH